jgi:hypothetical protein
MLLPKDWIPDNPDFRAFYGWPDSAGIWETETAVAQNGLGLVVHCFRKAGISDACEDGPPQAKGTLFMIHGYLE